MQQDPVSRLLDAIAAGDVPASSDVFAETAVVDATVPNWRYTMNGRDGIAAELARWYAAPGRLQDVRRTPLPGGELVEYCLSWEEQGEAWRAHQVHVLSVAGDRIEHDRVWCGGRWPAALVAQMEAAAHVG